MGFSFDISNSSGFNRRQFTRSIINGPEQKLERLEVKRRRTNVNKIKVSIFTRNTLSCLFFSSVSAYKKCHCISRVQRTSVTASIISIRSRTQKEIIKGLLLKKITSNVQITSYGNQNNVIM